jgi:DNA-binding CsgD family transcriptional regulator
MHVQALNEFAIRSDPVLSATRNLIASLGTAEFEVEVFEALHALTGCDHASVFVLPDGGAPRVLLAGSRDGTSVAWQAGKEYATRFWHLDPANRIELHSADDRCGTMVRTTRADIGAARYRRHCYSQADWARTGSKIIERISLHLREARSAYKVSLFRELTSGPFRDCDLGAAASCSGLLLALLRKHDQLSTTAGDGFEDYLDMLSIVAPLLSPREREVCAGIALGMTSEAIRLKLGLSLSTVQTHRKRAYARLRISSQNELLKLIFGRTTTH